MKNTFSYNFENDFRKIVNKLSWKALRKNWCLSVGKWGETGRFSILLAV